MYYLYKHIRLDKNEVFYIGIGKINTTDNTFRGYHRRAFEKKKSRNLYWRNIVSKTDYRVEIILYTDNEETIQQKEIEYINLYKKTLCNLTEGGYGITSYKHNQKTKEKIRKASLGRSHTKETIEILNTYKRKKVIMYNDTEELIFNSRTEAAIFLGNIKFRSNISRYLRFQKFKVCGYMFKEITELEDKEPLR